MYRSGPAEPSFGAAENASHLPSFEYLASPMIVTPLAISICPEGVASGVGPALPGGVDGASDSLGDEVSLGDLGGWLASPVSVTGWIRILLPAVLPSSDSYTTWLLFGEM